MQKVKQGGFFRLGSSIKKPMKDPRNCFYDRANPLHRSRRPQRWKCSSLPWGWILENLLLTLSNFGQTISLDGWRERLVMTGCLQIAEALVLLAAGILSDEQPVWSRAKSAEDQSSPAS